MQIRTGEEIGIVCLVSPLVCSFVCVLCLDRQILFEKELRPLPSSSVFSKSEVKILQRFYDERSLELRGELWSTDAPWGMNVLWSTGT